ncbi:MAG: DMT family transporter [Alphaproteobacteria bacterium]|nr:DMT family transporter [Alphaproteobacteria bacterium]
MSLAELNLATMRANRRGIVTMCAAMAVFIVNDAIVKHVSESLGGGQLIFLRGLFATLLILATARAMGLLGRPAQYLSGPVLLRAVVDAVATFTYLTALFNMPIANVTAINLASPLILTALAVVVLKELVGWRRWSAIFVGFMGVLLVIQPTAEGFNIYALVALAATLMHAARDLVTRRIPASVPSLVPTLVTAIVVCLLAGGISLVEGWRPVAPRHLAFLLMASVFLAVGYYLIIDAMRHGEMSLVGPFRYTGLLWALLLGYFIWGDVPNLAASLGIVLLIGSGLYTLHRERIRAREARHGQG